MNNDEAVAAFVTWMRERRNAPVETWSKYQRVCGSWAAHLPTPLAERDVLDVEEWLDRPRRGGVSPKAATVANDLAVIGSMYRWGITRLGWPRNPAALAGKPTVHNRQPRPVDDDDWLRVWSNPRLEDDARVVLGLGYFCGLRRAEMTSLHASQVWGGALVNFTRKGDCEDRFDYRDLLDHWDWHAPHLLVDPDLLDLPLRRLARRGDQALLPWGPWLSPRAVNKRLARWLDECGLASDAFTPHSLRHSFATNLLRSGVPLDVACDLCNHSSPTITMRYVRTGGGRLASMRDGERPAPLRLLHRAEAE